MDGKPVVPLTCRLMKQETFMYVSSYICCEYNACITIMHNTFYICTTIMHNAPSYISCKYICIPMSPQEPERQEQAPPPVVIQDLAQHLKKALDDMQEMKASIQTAMEPKKLHLWHMVVSEEAKQAPLHIAMTMMSSVCCILHHVTYIM